MTFKAFNFLHDVLYDSLRVVWLEEIFLQFIYLSVKPFITADDSVESKTSVIDDATEGMVRMM